jgi:MFS family permease
MIPTRRWPVRVLWRLLADQRDYRLLVSAGLVSSLGDYLLGVGLVYLVYDLTGSTLASAGLLVVSVLPQALLASVAGVLVDRWDRRRTLAATLLLQVVVLAPLLVVTDDSRIWLLYVVAAAQSVLEQLSTPAEQALVPHLVPVDRLVSANAVNGQARNLARLVGSGVGGVVAAWGGLPALALVDAATFVAAALLVLAIRPTAAHLTLADPSVEPGAPTPWWQEWRAGLSVAARSRVLRVLLLFSALTAVGEGVMGTLFAPFVRDVLHGGPQGYGLVVGIQAVGGIAGGLVVAAVGDRFRPARLLAAASVVFGLVDLAIFLYPLVWVSLVPALVLMAVVGVPGAAVSASFLTLLQRATDDAFRGRVFGTLLGLQSGGVLVGSVLAGWLGGLGDGALIATIAWQGAGYVLMGVVVAASLIRRGDRAPEQLEAVEAGHDGPVALGVAPAGDLPARP